MSACSVQWMVICETKLPFSQSPAPHSSRSAGHDLTTAPAASMSVPVSSGNVWLFSKVSKSPQGQQVIYRGRFETSWKNGLFSECVIGICVCALHRSQSWCSCTDLQSRCSDSSVLKTQLSTVIVLRQPWQRGAAPPTLTH